MSKESGLMQIMERAAEAIKEELDLFAMSALTGVPVEELRPKPQPPRYDPRPLHEAIASDSLVCGSVTEHGHGASETYAVLRYKRKSWSELSENDYMELVRLAKIGLVFEPMDEPATQPPPSA